MVFSFFANDTPVSLYKKHTYRVQEEKQQKLINEKIGILTVKEKFYFYSYLFFLIFFFLLKKNFSDGKLSHIQKNKKFSSFNYRSLDR